jgi:hypothetical protein
VIVAHFQSTRLPLWLESERIVFPLESHSDHIDMNEMFPHALSSNPCCPAFCILPGLTWRVKDT